DISTGNLLPWDQAASRQSVVGSVVGALVFVVGRDQPSRQLGAAPLPPVGGADVVRASARAIIIRTEGPWSDQRAGARLGREAGPPQTSAGSLRGRGRWGGLGQG